MANVHQIFDVSGAGNFSNTINKNNLGQVGQGTWIGEESPLLNGELPQIYTAIAIGEVHAFQVSSEDFFNVVPPEIIKALTEKSYSKLFMVREKLQVENQKRQKIEKMDHKTEFLAKTVDHMQSIFP
jgi:hypothetical protein